MTKMNQKGQAFSVFKLLIAAIVAVFILALLLQILSNITPPSQGDPTDEAASKIKTLLTKLGTPERTAVVTFEPGKILSARTIADKTGALAKENVCVTLGESDATNNNFSADGVTIIYSGSSNVQRRLYILCDLEDKINETITTDLTSVDLVQKAFNGGAYDCTNPSGAQNRYCIVSVIPTGT